MKKLLPAVLLAILAGCASPPPDVTTRVDQFTNERADVMEDILLKPPSNPPRELLWLRATRYAPQFNRTPIYLGVKYMSKAEVGPLEVEPGQSLTIVTDGEPIKLGGIGSLNQRRTFTQNGQDFITETANYEITPRLLNQIAHAKKVRVQLRGKNGLIERDFDSETFDRFRRFVSYLAI